MSTLLKIAFEELGQAEIAGQAHNPRIVQYAQESGFQTIQDDETPWCSIFVNYCCDKLNLPKSGEANARSWMHIGKKTIEPEPGDVVVFWRESPESWKGHVGFFLGFNHNQTKVFCLGGNQGNKVGIDSYDAAKVLGFRSIQSVSKMAVPNPTLEAGNRGEEVVKLQTILNHLDYNCGDPDGIFGAKTVSALKLLQANHRVTVDGIYGNGSKDIIESLLQA